MINTLVKIIHTKYDMIPYCILSYFCLLYSLISCTGYKYLMIDDVKPGTVRERINGREGDICYLSIKGKLDKEDFLYLEEIIISSDIIKNIDLSNAEGELVDRYFAGCQSLETINLPNGNYQINNFLFSDCKKLKNVSIPENYSYIGIQAFKNCIEMEKIYLPASINEINNNAFENCTKLMRIDCASSEPPICHNDVFKGINTEECTVFIPRGSLSKYKNAVGWEKFTNLTEIKKVYNKETNWNKN